VSLSARFLPGLAEIVGPDPVVIDLDVPTVRGLLDRLARDHGAPARKALFGAGGAPWPELQILVNDREYVRHDQLDRPLSDGETVKLLLLLGGG
jgi:molybdopterin converting factor small subunit